MPRRIRNSLSAEEFMSSTLFGLDRPPPEQASTASCTTKTWFSPACPEAADQRRPPVAGRDQGARRARDVRSGRPTEIEPSHEGLPDPGQIRRMVAERGVEVGPHAPISPARGKTPSKISTPRASGEGAAAPQRHPLHGPGELERRALPLAGPAGPVHPGPWCTIPAPASTGSLATRSSAATASRSTPTAVCFRVAAPPSRQ